MYLVALSCLLFCFSPVARAVTYLSAEDFLAASFETVPKPATLWLTPEYQDAARQILGHAYAGLRLRYWQQDDRTAWILEEIGKERPITMGIVVAGGDIARVEILEYREPRGDEVRHPFFTRQLIGLGLDSNLGLTGRIDGITGATLSVRAVTNVSRFALYLAAAVTVKQ